MDRKEEMVAAARELADRTGAPTLRLATYLNETGYHANQVYRHFASWPSLCHAAGVRACRRNRRDTEADIFAAMHDAFTETGGVCTRAAFIRLWGCGEGTLNNRFGSWTRALEGFRRWATDNAPGFPHMEAVDARLGWLAAASRREPGAPGPFRSAPSRVHPTPALCRRGGGWGGEIGGCRAARHLILLLVILLLVSATFEHPQDSAHILSILERLPG